MEIVLRLIRGSAAVGSTVGAAAGTVGGGPIGLRCSAAAGRICLQSGAQNESRFEWGVFVDGITFLHQDYRIGVRVGVGHRRGMLGDHVEVLLQDEGRVPPCAGRAARRRRHRGRVQRQVGRADDAGHVGQRAGVAEKLRERNESLHLDIPAGRKWRTLT